MYRGFFYPGISPSSRAQVLLAERAVRARLELVAAISYLKTHAALQVDSCNLQPASTCQRPDKRVPDLIACHNGCFEVMHTIRLTALITIALATPAMADATVPEEYQGVWASAQDCRQKMQNVLPHVVNRQNATCRVMQVLSSGRPGWHANTIYLNCGGSRSREIWHDENIDGADFLVTVEFEKGGEAGGLLIDIYKRCPEIPVGEIPFSDIPGTDTRR
jgi:hypothetical protein